MNVVDSSGWLEYFTDDVNADFFAPVIEDTAQLIVPSISIYEVFKRILQQRSQYEALLAAAVMVRSKVVELDVALSMDAAKTAVEMQLPMADSIILTTARRYNAIFWTQDSDFKNIPGIRYIEKLN
jgi:toxin FitB